MVEKTRYLLDSDIVITMLRDRTDKSGLRQKALNVGLENCYVSSVTLAELSSGAYRMPSERGFHELAFVKTIFNILPFGDVNSNDSDIFGRCKSLLYASGTPIDDMDLMIGSSAAARGLVMVTHNTRHFSRIPDLVVEDWL